MRKFKINKENMVLCILFLNYISFLNIKLYTLYSRITIPVNIFVFSLALIGAKYNKKMIKEIGYFLLVSIFCLSSILSTGGGVGSVLTLINSLGILFVFKKIKLKNLWPWFKKILLIMIIYIYTISPDYYTKFLRRSEDIINPNTYAQIVVYSTIYLLCYINRNKKEFLKSIIIIFLCTKSVLNLESRGALLCLIIFVILNFIIPKQLIKKEFIKIFYWLTVGGGILFTRIYVNLYLNGIDFKIPFIEKNLYTGREMIWASFYKVLDKSLLKWLGGIGSNVNLWEGSSQNLHNNYLAVITTFGLIGFFIYYGYIYYFLIEILEKRLKNYDLSLVLGFLSTMFLGYFEVVTFNSMTFYVNFLFLGLAFNSLRISPVKKGVKRCKMS